jgi:hypothetical protein
LVAGPTSSYIKAGKISKSFLRNYGLNVVDSGQPRGWEKLGDQPQATMNNIGLGAQELGGLSPIRKVYPHVASLTCTLYAFLGSGGPKAFISFEGKRFQ